jgi:hypothetical protein
VIGIIWFFRPSLTGNEVAHRIENKLFTSVYVNFFIWLEYMRMMAIHNIRTGPDEFSKVFYFLFFRIEFILLPSMK